MTDSADSSGGSDSSPAGEVSNNATSPDYSAAAADANLLRIPLIAVFVAGVICTVVATLVDGSKGALAGALGTVVVLAFFGLSQYVIGRVLRNNPALAMNVALLVYVVQMAVLFLLLLILKDATFFNGRVFALTVVAGALVWTGSAVWVLARSKVLYVEPGSGPGQGT